MAAASPVNGRANELPARLIGPLLPQAFIDFPFVGGADQRPNPFLEIGVRVRASRQTNRFECVCVCRGSLSIVSRSDLDGGTDSPKSEV